MVKRVNATAKGLTLAHVHECDILNGKRTFVLKVDFRKSRINLKRTK